MIRDELDALLQEEDRRLDREAKRAGVRRREVSGATGDVAGDADLNVRKPLKGLWELGSTEEDAAREGYHMQKAAVERSLDRLERMLAEQREKYDFVPVQKKRDKDAMLGDWAWLCIYCLLLAVLQMFFQSGNAISEIAAIVLVVFWAGGFVKLVRDNVNQTLRYLVRCNKEWANDYVEARRIATYEKQLDYYYQNISKVKERLEKVKRLDARLEREGFLTESEVQTIREMVEVHLKPNQYPNESGFTVKDWLSFRTSAKRGK